ncbi:hypothetical protein IAU59_004364 [Kwoniella sp. CBS 9459]
MSSSLSPLIPCRHGKATIAFDDQAVIDVNTISDFLTSPCNPLGAPDDGPGTVYVLAGNAILPLAEMLFDHVASLDAERACTLVISGGIGHSTVYLYEAVLRHPKYCALYTQIQGLSEAETLHAILIKYWPELATRVEKGSLNLLIDQKSTNCGANAVESKRLLDENGIWPNSLYIVQDPTMHRRTAASFDKIYTEDIRSSQTAGTPKLLPSSFTPHLALSTDNRELCWSLDPDQWKGRGSLSEGDLWDVERFVSLIMGEIPRLRDDGTGYGPKGAGFISHVEIPAKVEQAWARLSSSFAVRKA